VALVTAWILRGSRSKRENVLYYMPQEGEGLATAAVEVPQLRQLVVMQGDQDNPVHHVAFSGFQFTHTTTVYMEYWEVPSMGPVEGPLLEEIDDPMFEDEANGDFRLKPESPAHALGIEGFTMQGWGLLPEFPEPRPDQGDAA
jgi:hypothetical protein